MKKIAFSTAFLAFAIALMGQSPFRVKVIDSQTSENVEKAIVFIEEIPLPDQETDKYGVVSFQNVPEDRKVRVNVRKKGYLPNQTEVVANRAIKVDNNIIIKLQKEPTTPQVIIYGEVSDIKGNEIDNATVEVSILGKPFSTKTDKSGNYQIRVDGNVISSVPTFQFEVKKQGCTKMKSTENTPKSELVNKDVVLVCNGQSDELNGTDEGSSTPSSIPKGKIKNCLDGYEIKILNCKGNKGAQTVTIEFEFKHKLPHQTLTLFGSGTKAYGSSQEFAASKLLLGKSSRAVLPTDTPLNGTITFINVLPSNTSLKKVMVKIHSQNKDGGKGDQTCELEIDNINIDW